MARRKPWHLYHISKKRKGFHRRWEPRPRPVSISEQVSTYLAREGVFIENEVRYSSHIRNPTPHRSPEPGPSSQVPEFAWETPRRPSSVHEVEVSHLELSPEGFSTPIYQRHDIEKTSNDANPANNSILNDSGPCKSVPKTVMQDHSYAYSEKEVPQLPGNRVVNIKHLFEQLINDNHGPEDCGIKHLEFIREMKPKGHSSINTTLEFICRMCRRVKHYSLQPNNYDVEAAVAHGTVAGGVGYAAVDTLFAALNMPFISKPKFAKALKRVSKAVKSSLYEEMNKGAEEEKRHALQVGNVTDDGTPLITVTADGAWAKRSYKTKYDSLSGMASIIGYHTRKVLFVGIRNKYCAMCDRNQRLKLSTQHLCFKNWSKSSTSMEADIVLEGFRRSQEMHGLIYHRLIGDDDSNTSKMLKVGRPYGLLPVKKIKCRNHLLRNLCNYLRGTRKNTKFSVAERDAVLSNVLRVRRALRGAINHWKTEVGVGHNQQVLGLQRDVINVPRHIFGDHSECSNYYCQGRSSDEQPIYTQMEVSGLAEYLRTLFTNLAHSAESLLEDVDSNDAERLNSVANKMISGKRVFYGARGQYNLRVEAAAVQFTCGDVVGNVARVLGSGRTPGSRVKRYVARRDRDRMQQQARRKRLNFDGEPNRKRFKGGQTGQGKDESYGFSENYEDISSEDLKEKMDNFLADLRSQDPAEVEENTRGQALTATWHAERLKRLTASNFGKVVGLRKDSARRNCVVNILYKVEALRNLRHVQFGVENEAAALLDFKKVTNKEVENCGLFVDSQRPYLAASPDGLVIGEDALVEIKCLSAAELCKEKCSSLLAAVNEGKVKMCRVQNGRVELKKGSHWFRQIQGQLNITGRKKCYLVLWTSSELLGGDIRGGKG